MATILEIEERLEYDSIAEASLEHFKLQRGVEINPNVVIQQNTISPFCLDHESRELIFVDLPSDIDLSSVPFVYNAQREFATRLIAVSYDELPELANQIKLPETIILVFSTGRAGSTLMNQIFNEIDGVISFSEPDIFLNLVPIALRSTHIEESTNLLTYCLKLFVHQYADKIVAIKHRNQCNLISDLFYRAFPNAKNLFMYRHALEWIASWQRISLQQGHSPDVPIDQFRAGTQAIFGYSDHIDPFIPHNAKVINRTIIQSIIWVFLVDAYINTYEQGIPFLALRYRDLNTHRRQVLEKVFEYVGIPISTLDQAMHGFDRDSQAGTGLERAEVGGNTKKLDDANKKLVVETLAKHPRQFSPDMILPATLML